MAWNDGENVRVRPRLLVVVDVIDLKQRRAVKNPSKDNFLSLNPPKDTQPPLIYNNCGVLEPFIPFQSLRWNGMAGEATELAHVPYLVLVGHVVHPVTYGIASGMQLG